VKAVILAALIAGVGCAGGWVHREKGVGTRGAVQQQKAVTMALKWPDQRSDSVCLQKYKLKGTQYEEKPFCLYKNVGGKETIALVGDSHAWMLFDAIAKFNANNGINTVLLAHAGNNNVFYGWAADFDNTESLYQAIRSDSSIRKVFIVTASDYVHPDPACRENVCKERKVRNYKEFEKATQEAITRFSEMEKKVFILADNPYLPFNPRSVFVNQPLRASLHKRRADLRLYREDVLKRQKNYLEALSYVKGATIIFSIDAYCPAATGECLLFDENNVPLYSDSNHISPSAGGRFVVERILSPYLTAE
jgi:hypothetical protein